MKRFTTTLCSIAFMISGIMMALHTSDNNQPQFGMTAQAATLYPTISYPDLNMGRIESLPISGEAIERTDTVYIHDSIPVPTNKIQKVPVPKYITKYVTKTDTICYLATQVGNKEGPSNNEYVFYEVHKVDDIKQLKPNSLEVSTETEEPEDTCTSSEHIE